MDDLELTGERTLPDAPEENYWFQRHVAAYRFAAGIVSGRVLDVGAGEGYGAAALASGGATVIAFEYDAAVAAHAARRYDSIRVGIADACRLPVADRSIDAVVSLQVIEHLYCADRFVAACRRALRPGGVVVLSTPNRSTFSPGGTTNPFHVYEYTGEELAALLRVHFDRVELLGVRHRAGLALRERATGGSLSAALMAGGHQELSSRRRRLVARVRPEDFGVSARRVPEALDLVAMCRA